MRKNEPRKKERKEHETLLHCTALAFLSQVMGGPAKQRLEGSASIGLKHCGTSQEEPRFAVDFAQWEILQSNGLASYPLSTSQSLELARRLPIQSRTRSFQSESYLALDRENSAPIFFGPSIE